MRPLSQTGIGAVGKLPTLSQQAHPSSTLDPVVVVFFFLSLSIKHPLGKLWQIYLHFYRKPTVLTRIILERADME